MDLDRFLATNQPLWDRLGVLASRGSRGADRLSAEEIDELVRLYQRTSSHLSYVRTYYRDPALTARLTGLVAAGGAIVYGARPKTLRTLRLFFTESFPAALWHNRRFVAVAALLFYVPAIAVGVWLATSPDAIEAVGPPALREAYLNEDFESYYSSKPASEFAAQVTTNNIQVGFLAFAGGVLLGVPTVFLLVFNGANVGVPAGLFAAAGQNAKFYGLILPHGLLELTAVVIAGSAGLRLGWSLVDPGDRLRRDALMEEGRRSVVIVLGLVATFGVAGLIEGFVTGSGLPTFVRVGIGVMVEAVFLLYVFVLGRDAAARGVTGLLGEQPSGASSAPSAPTTVPSPSP